MGVTYRSEGDVLVIDVTATQAPRDALAWADEVRKAAAERGGPVAVLTHVHAGASIRFDAFAGGLRASLDVQPLIRASAIVVEDEETRGLFGAVERATSPPHPIRVFADVAAARAWLASTSEGSNGNEAA